MNNNPEIKRKKFFKNEEERNIWIRLNAERLEYCDKKDGQDVYKMGSIDEKDTYMWMSNNQLNCEELECDAPGFSLEELLTKSMPELYTITKKRWNAVILQIINEIKAENKRKEQKGRFRF